MATSLQHPAGDVPAVPGPGLTAGTAVTAAFRVARGDGDGDAVEVLRGDGTSVVLSRAHDGRLALADGHWPALPGWCAVADGWRHVAIGGIGCPGTDVVRAVAGQVDAAGAVVALEVVFADGAVMQVAAAPQFSWTFKDRSVAVGE